MPKHKLEPNKIIPCLNCEAKINTSDQYCHKCGQKIKSYNLSTWQLIKEVFSSIFNLDSKFAKTILNIWRPVYLTKAYVSGERKRFLNPGRLFIISFFLMSALISLLIKSDKEGIANNDTGQDLYHSDFRKEMLTAFDTLVLTYPTSPQENIDSLRHELFLSEKSMLKDSIESPPVIKRNPEDAEAGGFTIVTENKYRIATKDIHDLSKEELFSKYKVNGIINQVLFIQYIKLRENPTSFAIFMATNSLWSIILTTFFVALFMKLLYIRNKYYYVEHVVFLMLFQSLIFILAMGVVTIAFFTRDLAISLLYYIGIFFSIYLIYCLKKYYQQGFFKTLFKWFWIIVMEIIFLAVCLLIVLGVSFLIY